MQRLVAVLLIAAGMASGQTLQEDMQRISDAFEMLPPAQETMQRWKDQRGAQVWVELIRMNARVAEESEVRARYAKGKARRRFKAAQKRAERAEQNCIRELDRMEHAK
jgi:hypothetical protein